MGAVRNYDETEIFLKKIFSPYFAYSRYSHKGESRFINLSGKNLATTPYTTFSLLPRSTPAAIAAAISSPALSSRTGASKTRYRISVGSWQLASTFT